MTRPDYVLRQGDSGQRIEATLEDSDGVAVDLSGATIRFLMAAITGAEAIAAEAVNVQDDEAGDDGAVAYEWLPADTTDAGSFVAEWEVTYAGGSTVTYPNTDFISVLITEQIA